MTDRFSLGPLIGAAHQSLRVRSVHGPEPVDKTAVAALLVLPIAGGLASYLLGWTLDSPDSLTAGFSLLAAALLAVFVQLAAWRSRLSTDGKHDSLVLYEGPARRAVDEAVAHTLLASVLCIFGAALTVVMANADFSSPFDAIATAVVVGGGVRLLLTFVLIVNLAFDAYEEASTPASGAARAADEQQHTS